ncbi:hypothetical protein FGO68_gene2372 [Halteria grandinella]|uniref:Uncharacterized protein n=1 Tax=Halteria grandinella TaxID=5974 RepID=A0A8J8NEA6_HALGN|nr:hypothetical protein FGO68_gene2372 [Halteria grandinella]
MGNLVIVLGLISGLIEEQVLVALEIGVFGIFELGRQIQADGGYLEFIALNLPKIAPFDLDSFHDLIENIDPIYECIVAYSSTLRSYNEHLYDLSPVM